MTSILVFAGIKIIHSLLSLVFFLLEVDMDDDEIDLTVPIDSATGSDLSERAENDLLGDMEVTPTQESSHSDSNQHFTSCSFWISSFDIEYKTICLLI